VGNQIRDAAFRMLRGSVLVNWPLRKMPKGVSTKHPNGKGQIIGFAPLGGLFRAFGLDAPRGDWRGYRVTRNNPVQNPAGRGIAPNVGYNLPTVMRDRKGRKLTGGQ
jgi:hypothetical protein